MQIITFAGRGLLFRRDGPWRARGFRARFAGLDLPVLDAQPPADKKNGGVGALIFDWPAAGAGAFEVFADGRVVARATCRIGALSGGVDQVGAGRVTGWLARLGADARAPQAMLHMDGAPVARVTPSRRRGDLAAVSVRSGFDGFQAPIPPAAFDGAEHRFQLFSYDGAIGPELVWRLAYDLVLDADGDGVSGVCTDPAAPDRSLELALVTGGVAIELAKTAPPWEKRPGAFVFTLKPESDWRVAPVEAPGATLTPKAVSSDKARRAEPAPFASAEPPPAFAPEVRGMLIVVPVYAGRAEVAACLDSVVRALRPGDDLLVINDCSPDENIWRDLRARAAAEPRLRLKENAANKGFLGTVNSAFAEADGRDVAIVNADAVVPPGWLERMTAHLLSAPNVASVTAMSNNATILSYPQANVENAAPADVEALDDFFRVAGADAVDIPVGVGFCMVLRGDALAAVGPFDTLYGRGYSEEVDWCMRARAAGWRHLAASDVFAAHAGAVSFGKTARTALMEKNHAALLARFPDYEKTVRAFVEADPLRRVRNGVDRARLLADARPIVLHLTNANAGGTRRHIDDLCAIAERAGVQPLILRPRSDDERAESASDAGFRLETPDASLVSLLTAGEAAALIGDFVAARRLSFHLHSAIGWPAADLDAVLAVAPDAPMFATLHDYAAFCPRIQMLRKTHVFCGAPPLTECERCFKSDGPEKDLEAVGIENVAGWVDINERRLKRAKPILAPSAAAAAFHRVRFPDLEIHVAPHAEFATPGALKPVAATTRPLTVAVLGALGRHKGYEFVLQAAERIGAEKLPVRLRIIGSTHDDDALMRALPEIAISGPYNAGEIKPLLNGFETDIVLLPSIWPETYSYTLSEAWAAGYQAAVLDFGAPAERVRAQGGGIVLPASTPGLAAPEALLEAVDAGRFAEPNLAPRPAEEFYAEEYIRLIGGVHR